MSNPDLRALVFWIPGRLVNGLNAREHWSHDAKKARIQRDAVCAAVLVALDRRRLAVAPSVPKRIVFQALTGRLFDGDGLQSALKHIRDGCIDAGLIDDDRPSAGHSFEYEQLPGTPVERRGVRITVTVRGEGKSHAENSDAQARA